MEALKDKDSKQIQVQVDSSGNSTNQDLESSLTELLPYNDDYTRPSTELNGNITYLAELEESPQGRHLGVFSTLVLFISRILGSGFLAVSSGIYEDCGGSPFYFLLAWIIAAILAFSGLYVFLELGSLIPRSGGTKVFLEFIYDKPHMLATVVFLVYSVMFGFTILNILVFGEYFLQAIGIEPTEYKTRITGLLFLYVTALIHGLSVTHGIRIQNFLGLLKLGLAVIMVMTGIYTSFFPYSITKLENHLHWNEFFHVKTSISTSKFSSAVIKATFAYAGWNSVHTVSNEIKDPVRTFKIAGPLSLIIVTITYVFTNIAYLVVILDDEIRSSGKLIGSLLFEKVFGYRFGKQFLTFAAASCAGGNVFVVLYTISRTSQEVFKEGYLPFSQVMASNWPLDAPMPSIILSCFLSTVVVLGSPGKDIYGYIVSLEGYPNQIFIGLATIGIFIIRRRYPHVKAPIRASYIGTVLVLLIITYLSVSPLATRQSPNPEGLENWPNFAIVAIMCMVACVSYWAIMFRIFPKIFGYELISEDFEQEDGLVVKKWIKVYR